MSKICSYFGLVRRILVVYIWDIVNLIVIIKSRFLLQQKDLYEKNF